MRILLAFNDSELSQAALQAVVAQHRPQNTEVNVLCVIPLDTTQCDVIQAQELVDRAGQARQAAGFKVVTTVLKDIVMDAIVGTAEEWDADLIVLGWHGRTALKRFMLGSLPNAVLHQAPCSVELVRIRLQPCTC